MITGKVLGSTIDDNGNIKVKTEYTLTDGSKTIGHTRYNFFNFSKERILTDVKIHCETLMTKAYGLKRHQELVATKVDDITHQCTQVEITVKPAVLDAQGNITTPAETLIIDDK